MSLPDLSSYAPHRSLPDADFEGTAVPGLRADFYRRAEGDRVASVGRYSYRGREVLLAWGYVDEEHCRRHAVRDHRGGWQPVVEGCPDVRFVRDGDTVVGVEVRTPSGAWLRCAAEHSQAD